MAAVFTLLLKIGVHVVGQLAEQAKQFYDHTEFEQAIASLPVLLLCNLCP
jgi:hypothetical protein